MESFDDRLLLFDKPYRWTSFDVVNKIKRLLKLKVGHAGTLDPLATGLLIVCTGSWCKKIEELKPLDKEYTGTMILGAVTPSYDLETEISDRFPIDHLTPSILEEKAREFLGKKEQLPPAHSAKFHQGARYYELAREGKEFERKTHEVTLHEFRLTRIELPEVDFSVTCGKGFYIRSLVHDFGESVNSGAYLSSLRRTRIGEYLLADAWQMKDFENFVRANESS